MNTDNSILKTSNEIFLLDDIMYFDNDGIIQVYQFPLPWKPCRFVALYYFSIYKCYTTLN